MAPGITYSNLIPYHFSDRERLVADIKEHVEELESKEGCRVKQLSFIGYSMGGLVTRYAVGRLEHEVRSTPSRLLYDNLYVRIQLTPAR